jgi:hypothetical protein
MRKMSKGVAALFLAGFGGLGCTDQSGLKYGGGSGGANGGHASGGISGILGGSGGLNAGSTGGSQADSGGTSGTGGCIPPPCFPLDCAYGYEPSTSPCGCGGCAPPPNAGGGAIGLGGAVGSAGMGASGTGGTASCSTALCFLPACVGGEFRPNPSDPCGCPICVLNAPDAGVTKDARVPDSGSLCGPIACPMLACVNGYVPNPEPCGCPTCAPPDAGVAKDATPTTACPMLASLNSTDATQVGYSAARALVKCADTDGSSSFCLNSDITACPGPVAASGVGASVGCSNLCATNQYGLSYGGVGPSAVAPSIDLPVGCNLGLQTPGGVAFYCCPCGS